MNLFANLNARDVASSLTFIGMVVVLWLVREPLLDFVLLSNDTTLTASTYERLAVVYNVVAVALSAILGMVVYLELTLHTQAHHLAEEMMSDLIMSREQFRLLYDNSPMPYFLIDDRGLMHNPNKAALRFFSATAEELEETDLFDRVARDDKTERSLPMLRSKIERGVPISREELQLEPLRGTPRWVLISIFTVDRTSPLQHKKLVSLVDVTEEKEIDRVKTEFVSLASHQLRTPLTTIKWYIDLLLTSKSITLSDEAREHLNKVYIGNQRMIDLVSTLLNVSRIEMGTVPVELGNVDIGEVVQDILDEVDTSTKDKKIVIEAQVTATGTIRTDRNLVRIAIQNLVTNAIRYTPAEGRVTVRTENGANGCVVSVTDTGCGIPPESFDKLFTKMYRAENAKKLEAKGTGLGLYMTKAFVEKLGGTIDFTSTLGQGTTFTLHLPKEAHLAS